MLPYWCVRPSSDCYTAFSLPIPRSPRFGSITAYCGLCKCFCAACMTYTQTKTRRQFGKFLSPIGCNHNYQSALKNLCAVLNIRRAYFSAHLVNSYCTVSQKNIDSQAHALFRLGFPSLTPSGLGLHAIITRWLIIQKVRHQTRWLIIQKVRHHPTVRFMVLYANGDRKIKDRTRIFMKLIFYINK